jgi:hypothetical protein
MDSTTELLELTEPRVRVGDSREEIKRALDSYFAPSVARRIADLEGEIARLRATQATETTRQSETPAG